MKEDRIEIFNLKNKECQKKFKEETTAANNKKYLSSVFDELEDINILSEKFLKRLQKTIHKSFRKVLEEQKEKTLKKMSFIKNGKN